MSKQFISWSQFADDTLSLSESLRKENKEWSILVAIARGGLVPAALIAHHLSIRWVDTVCINSYDDESFQQHELDVLKELKSESHNILVLDDLVDTGKTYQLVKTMLPNAHYAAVYAKPKGKLTTDTYYKEFPQDAWIVFPWEQEVDARLAKTA